MSTAGGAGRRADFLGRLEQAEQRQDAAASDQAADDGERQAAGEQSQRDRDAIRDVVEAARQAAGEWQAAAREVRQLVAELRLTFRELLDETCRRPPTAPPETGTPTPTARPGP